MLDNLPEGAFVTVSNHHFGALDGIILIDLIASRRPRYKVMVNMFLNYIWAMRPNFIAVDAMASDDPKKKAVSMAGIREVIKMVRRGDPVGFFPAGAVAKVNWRGRLQDRQWQPTIIQIIDKLKVPVVPIFFHGSQSWWFNFLGVVCWQARTFRHPAEVFRKKGKTFHITVGEPISLRNSESMPVLRRNSVISCDRKPTNSAKSGEEESPEDIRGTIRHRGHSQLPLSKVTKT